MNKEEYNKSQELSHVLEKYSNLGAIEKEMVKDVAKNILSLDKERREMFKYVGTLSGAGAALSPQMIPYVDSVQEYNFFIGVFFLVITTIIAMLYIVSAVEKDKRELIEEFKKQEDRLHKIKQINKSFIYSNHSLEKFIEYSRNTKFMSDDLTQEDKDKRNRKEIKDNKFYQKLDYASEYILWFFSCGVMLLIISTMNINIDQNNLIFYGFLIFISIVLISFFQNKVFILLGFPVDIVRASVKWVGKKIGSQNTIKKQQ